MSVMERVAYLKGLAEGLDIDTSEDEGKLLLAIIEVLGEISEEIDGMSTYVAELSDQVDAIDEDLDLLETCFFEEQEDDDDFDDFDFDDEYYDVQCSKCDQEFTVDEETLLKGSLVCPGCGENIDFELEDDMEEFDEDF